MFGIKTNIVKLSRKACSKLVKGKLTNDLAIQELMRFFRADVYGHRAKVEKADLGYGWVHYGMIRAIKPNQVLCIGSRHGFIPAVLAQGCKDNSKGHVDFVDPGYGPNNEKHWTGVGYWRTKEGKGCFKRYGLDDWIRLYVMKSEEFARKIKDRKYEYIYIDGDHSYEGVSHDYELFWSRVNTHGFMSFHDVNVKKSLPEGTYGVYKLWKKIGKKNTILFPFEGSGLGLLQRN